VLIFITSDLQLGFFRVIDLYFVIFLGVILLLLCYLIAIFFVHISVQFIVGSFLVIVFLSILRLFFRVMRLNITVIDTNPFQ
jgi:hypothetical protein